MRLFVLCRGSFFAGTYEPEMTALWMSLLRPGMVAYDVGAHFGWFSLIASQWVGPSGRVVAFEPFPFNAWILQRHILLNRLSNVLLFPVALSDEDGRRPFAAGSSTGTGHLVVASPLHVPSFRLDTLLSHSALPPPQIVKIDVEGAEGG